MKATEATLPLPWLPFTRAEQGHVQSDEQLRSETGRPLEVHRQFVTYRVDELHPHPSYVRHHLLFQLPNYPHSLSPAISYF